MGFIDVVRWDWQSVGGRDGGDPVYAWRFPETNLSTLTQLLVAESQEAVLFSKGKVLGKFGAGKHTLNTENLPGLRSLFGIPFGGKNPFTAEVWFVNKAVPLNIDWVTDPMMYHDPDYQALVPLIAKGRYGLRVENAEQFLIKLVGIAESYSARNLTNHFKGELVARTNTLLMRCMQRDRIGIKSIAGYLTPLSEALKAEMSPFWDDYGFSLTGFYMTSVQVDSSSPEGHRILDAMSRQSAQHIAGYTWQQSQAFGVADRAVDSGGGLLGAVMMGGLMGAGGAGGLLQPTPSQGSPHAPRPGDTAPSPQVRDVFCSNCARKYSNTMKFCPHCGDPYTPCARCGADNSTTAKRCVSCGEVRASGTECVNCHGMIPSDSAFCPQCGKSRGGSSGCTRCGSPLDGRVVFCPQCGQKAGQ